MNIFHTADLLGISVVGSKVLEPGIIHSAKCSRAWWDHEKYPRWRTWRHISQSSSWLVKFMPRHRPKPSWFPLRGLGFTCTHTHSHTHTDFSHLRGRWRCCLQADIRIYPSARFICRLTLARKAHSAPAYRAVSTAEKQLVYSCSSGLASRWSNPPQLRAAIVRGASGKTWFA